MSTMAIGNILLSGASPDLPSKSGGDLPNFTPLISGFASIAGANIVLPSVENIANTNTHITKMPPVDKVRESYLSKLTAQSYTQELTSNSFVHWKIVYSEKRLKNKDT